MKVDYGGPHVDSKEGLESIQYSWEIGRSSYLILKRIRIEELSEGETGYHENIHTPDLLRSWFVDIWRTNTYS